MYSYNCPECGNKVNENEKECANCGCPINVVIEKGEKLEEDKAEQIKTGEDLSQPFKNPGKKLTGIAISFFAINCLVAMAILIIAVIYLSKMHSTFMWINNGQLIEIGAYVLAITISGFMCFNGYLIEILMTCIGQITNNTDTIVRLMKKSFK